MNNIIIKIFVVICILSFIITNWIYLKGFIFLGLICFLILIYLYFDIKHIKKETHRKEKWEKMQKLFKKLENDTCVKKYYNYDNN